MPNKAKPSSNKLVTTDMKDYDRLEKELRKHLPLRFQANITEYLDSMLAPIRDELGSVIRQKTNDLTKEIQDLVDEISVLDLQGSFIPQIESLSAYEKPIVRIFLHSLDLEIAKETYHDVITGNDSTIDLEEISRCLFRGYCLVYDRMHGVNIKCEDVEKFKESLKTSKDYLNDTLPHFSKDYRQSTGIETRADSVNNLQVITKNLENAQDSIVYNCCNTKMRIHLSEFYQVAFSLRTWRSVRKSTAAELASSTGKKIKDDFSALQNKNPVFTDEYLSKTIDLLKARRCTFLQNKNPVLIDDHSDKRNMHDLYASVMKKIKIMKEVRKHQGADTKLSIQVGTELIDESELDPSGWIKLVLNICGKNEDDLQNSEELPDKIKAAVDKYLRTRGDESSGFIGFLAKEEGGGPRSSLTDSSKTSLDNAAQAAGL